MKYSKNFGRKSKKHSTAFLYLLISAVLVSGISGCAEKTGNADVPGDEASGSILSGVCIYDSPENAVTDVTCDNLPKQLPDEETRIEMLAEQILDSMTIEEKAAQMFVVRCPQSDADKIMQENKFGGYILFGNDFSDITPEQAASNIESYKSASEIAPIIAVDEEGGTVCRVSRYSQFRSSPYLSPSACFKSGGWEMIESETEDRCSLLKSLGINFNFAPVCDVVNSDDDFMADRAFSKDAGESAEFVSKTVEIMKENNMGSVLKHFPGYGSNVDTHTGIAYDSRTYEDFESRDFIPFESGIEKGADMILVSHNIVKCMDETMPASLSPKVHEILRNELKFDGVIITDALGMQGITDLMGSRSAAVEAVKAGNDLLCCDDWVSQLPAVTQALRDGDISPDRADESVMRILKMKIRLGIIEMTDDF